MKKYNRLSTWFVSIMGSVAGFLLASPGIACTVIDGDRITGAALAAENLGFVTLDPTIDLGPAPLAGSDRVLRAFELENLAKKHGVILFESAPHTACFKRATQTLTEAELLPVLRRALDDQAATIEIVDFNRHELPLGYAEFEQSGLAASGLWRGRVVFAENRSVPIWARVRITGPDGRPIANWQTVTEPVVRPGEIVQVEVTSGGVLLAFEAAAQSSGHIGETVVIRNPANGRRFSAIVEAPGKVSIQP